MVGPLGTRISLTGNCNISLEHLKEKALHALFSSRKHTNFSKLKPSLACKIFEAMISPILSYNGEIWGVYAKHDFKAWDNTPIEKTHLKFCKRYLEISNKASNVALIFTKTSFITYRIFCVKTRILLLNKSFVPR